MEYKFIVRIGRRFTRSPFFFRIGRLREGEKGRLDKAKGQKGLWLCIQFEKLELKLLQELG